ncbi:restriction endonuclease subunit S [Alistipes shahii]
MGLILNDLKNACELEHVCDYVNNRTTSSMNYISTENMLPNKGGISESTIIPPGTTTEYKIGDILISNIRPYFQKIWCADRCGGCSADVLCIRAKENTDSKYLYYLLSQQAFFDYVMSGAKGCKMPRGDKKQIMQWPVNIPAIDVQKKVVAILSSLDNKIRLNRRINDNLEEQAKALFKSWFVDFEPFKGGKFVDSKLGPIPEGWSIGKVNDVVQILSGFAFKSETFVQSGPYRLITIKGVQDGYLDISGASYISKVPLKMPAYCNLEIGDILLSLTGNVGRVCIVDRPNLLLNQRVAKLQPRRDKQDLLFVYILFRQDTFKNHLLQIARGTAQLNLSPVETREISIILPPANVLLEFSKIGQYLFDKIALSNQETLRLSALRDTLLPKLMSGELSVEEVSFD